MKLLFNDESEYEVIASMKLTKYYESKFQDAPTNVDITGKEGTMTFNGEKFNFTLDEQQYCELYDARGKFIGPVDRKINLKTPSMLELKKQREDIKLRADKEFSQNKQAIIGSSSNNNNNNLSVKQKNGKSKLSKIIKNQKSSPLPSEVRQPEPRSPRNANDSSSWMTTSNFSLKDRVLHILAINDQTFGDIRMLTKAPQQELIKLLKEVI